MSDVIIYKKINGRFKKRTIGDSGELAFKEDLAVLEAAIKAEIDKINERTESLNENLRGVRADLTQYTADNNQAVQILEQRLIVAEGAIEGLKEDGKGLLEAYSKAKEFIEDENG